MRQMNCVLAVQFVTMLAHIIDVLMVHLGNLGLFACVTNLYILCENTQFAVDLMYDLSSSFKNFLRLGFLEAGISTNLLYTWLPWLIKLVFSVFLEEPDKISCSY